jgi:lysophospholipase L1-like esterase
MRIKQLLPAFALLTLAAQASASTLNQNVSWTIDRPGTSTTYRVVAYGDSIYAGYNGSTVSAAKYSAPTVEAEYLSALWNADIESVRRTKSGAIASDVYNNKIVAERSYMQASNTRVVTFEMCGNDGLQARTAYKSQTGTCDDSVLIAAENNCKTYVAAAMDYINANAYPGVKMKIISNLHYPGYAADNVQSSCKQARAKHVQAGQHRPDCQHAGEIPAIAGPHQPHDVRHGAPEGFPVRRQLRAIHGRGL